uniref:DUF3667 domain-containing protein n=1 Tax=Polaribacter sp. TaxID=1920175 RepID=UPI004047DABF
MKKSKKLNIIRQTECLNCGYPFFGGEKFCPECGQSNRDKQVTFGEFIYEIFNGFFSWDAKFWNTIVPLLVKPGKVSKDYIEGKRERYTNPFRFYLTISILFFVMLGVTDSYERLNDFRNGNQTKSISANLKDLPLDSIQNEATKGINDALKEVDSTQKKEILSNIKSAKGNLSIKNTGPSFKIGDTELNKFMDFQEKHPYMPIDNALDSLGVEKSFWNRFMYNRSEKISAIWKKDDGMKDFIQQIFSYASISLFVLLPFFTLFLKFFYIRRHYTYVEHLVFVFHTQTVFFLLLTLFYLVNFFLHPGYIIGIFILLFLIYLFLAMKRFYGQGGFKTFIKFCMLNTVYFVLGTIGILFTSIAAFLFY